MPALSSRTGAFCYVPPASELGRGADEAAVLPFAVHPRDPHFNRSGNAAVARSVMTALIPFAQRKKGGAK